MDGWVSGGVKCGTFVRNSMILCSAYACLFFVLFYFHFCVCWIKKSYLVVIVCVCVCVCVDVVDVVAEV